ncbi:F0F1 ATP synthase subunit epsilon [Metamycoplasma neophronis]|uniref:F0F1 ATP synthase subunit epsilon n=1 Tax=Metamycoplasma neophronis TaxID=872983 RepID=A0ABY2Z1A0_9BACT|nr:F0F1 ATP synthase subunit epsilon [Metamycoplasma neophronis]TPR54324.1 F0F1 ATP synthase subunit epsilon [Metamycoplasma neophronis]
MALTKIQVVISTPLGVYFDDMADICTFRTTEGQIGLMAGGPQFMAALVPSEIYINSTNSPDLKKFYIDKGIVQFKDNVLSLIVNEIDTQPIDLTHNFVQQDQKKYTIIEEIVLKKKLAENNK